MHLRLLSCLALMTRIASGHFHESAPYTPDAGISRGLEPSAVLNGLFDRAEALCGPGVGNCSDGNCCSKAGYCGKTYSHCGWPICQTEYGRCDPPVPPRGPSTDIISRPRLGKVPYGPLSIRSCTVPGTVALTFDDGPNKYTSAFLDLLDRFDANVTFFITGNENAKTNGVGKIDSEPSSTSIQRMHTSGHQIASHTWSHLDLSVMSKEHRHPQMIWNEMALRNILGGFPTYMRPPYSSCTGQSGCLDDMSELGYHIILYDIDTEDFRYNDPASIQKSKDIFDKHIDQSKHLQKPWLVIAHDVHEQTAFNLTEHMLKKLSASGYRAVTVGDCLGDPKENWYRTDPRYINGLLSGPSSHRSQKISSDPIVPYTGPDDTPSHPSHKPPSNKSEGAALRAGSFSAGLALLFSVALMG
ncbi:hypothetical protein ATEG_02485 [Aspergillus terreus NIH2624]|uniref:Chitin deacetylase n=1 Tax=Aspergillus terreus (strain NIH 2624 / FGSC A1156) TaxID=341663 RepID=Q0CUZ9_ASPTN|nr:uncharacterized protein ATEG_02485 [Aspergillus terreus NIH2624]EAU37447.1 hypothetical protein ATEG_02485 [Aspergillus terreus NIH2624]